MNRIPKKEIAKWIDALRSGEYKQGMGTLEPRQGQYCCLGVACKVFIPQDKIRFDGSRLFGAVADSYDQPKSPKWLQVVNDDFDNRTNKALTQLNDDDNFSFDEIADMLQLCYIEKAKFK